MDIKNIRPCKLSLIIASLLASNGVTAAQKTFAPLPLAIKQSETLTAPANPPKNPPNIMLIFDDTSSMRAAYRNRRSGSSEPIDPDADSTDAYTKTYFMKQAVKEVFSDPTFQDANYYAMDICGTGGGRTDYRDEQGNKVFDYNINDWKKNPRPSYQKPEIGKPLTGKEGLEKLKAYINSITPNSICGGDTDHLVEAYYEALYFMRKNMNEASGQYRCTTNAIILITDSATNQTGIKWDERGVVTAYNNISANEKKYNGDDTATSYWFKRLPKGVKQQPGAYWDCPTREYWSQVGYETSRNNYEVPQRSDKRMTPYYDWLDRYNNQQCRFIYSPDWEKYSTYEKNRTFSGVNQDILGAPTDYVSTHPLVSKETAKNPTDAAGVAWDAPQNSSPGAPTWPRNIVSYSVGFPYVNGESSQTGTTDFNLINSISTGHNKIAFSASDTRSLVNALKSALNSILSRSEVLSIPTAYSYTSPATLGTKDLIKGIGVYLNDNMTRSNLKITAFKNDKFDINDIQTPTFNSNKLFLTWHKSPTENNIYNLGDYKSREKLAEAINNTSNLTTAFGMPQNSSANDFKNKLGRLLAEPNADIGDNYRKYNSEFPMGNVIDSPVIPGGKLINDFQDFLVTSANDGMTYIFKYKSGNARHPYELAYRYLPLQMDRSNNDGTDTIGSKLYGVFNANYALFGGPQRVWLNNGGITVRSIKSRNKQNKEQHTFMVGSPGQGGRGVFALQIGGEDLVGTNTVGASKSDFNGSDVIIFETPQKKHNKLGYVFGNPTIARLSLCRNEEKKPLGNEVTIQPKLYDEATISCTTSTGGKSTDNLNLKRGIFYTAIYGNGFNSPDKQQSALEVRQIFKQDVGLDSTENDKTGESGTLIRRIEIPDNYAGLAMPAVVDMNFDGVVDIAYAATQDGQLYRFDLRGATPEDWKAVHIFTTQEMTKTTLKDAKKPSKGVDENGKQRQPVIIAPNVYRFTKKSNTCYMVMFGTGSNIYESDLADRTVQSIYSIEDCPDDKTAGTVQLEDLVRRELIDGNAKDTRFVEKMTDKPKKDKSKGWYANLDSKDSHQNPSGERIVTTPIIITGSAIYSSVSYATGTDESSANKPDPCKTVSTNIESGSTGWLMLFTARHGDAPTEENGATIEQLAASDEQGNKAVGIFQSDATNFTLFSVSDDKEQQSALTRDGNLVSGLEDELNPNPTPPKNDCLTQSEADRTKLIGQSREGLKDGFVIKPPVCPEKENFNLIRLNLREIIPYNQ